MTMSYFEGRMRDINTEMNGLYYSLDFEDSDSEVFRYDIFILNCPQNSELVDSIQYFDSVIF